MILFSVALFLYGKTIRVVGFLSRKDWTFWSLLYLGAFVSPNASVHHLVAPISDHLPIIIPTLRLVSSLPRCAKHFSYKEM